MPTIRLALRESEDNIFHCKNAVYVTHAIICAPRRIYKLRTQAFQLKQELPPSSVFRRNTYSRALKSPPRQHRSSEVSDISRGPRCGNRVDQAANTSTNASGSTVCRRCCEQATSLPTLRKCSTSRSMDHVSLSLILRGIDYQ